MSGEMIPSIHIRDIDWEKCWFNPGCAMSIYKPELIEPMLTLLREHFGAVKYHDVCCRHDPGLPEGRLLSITVPGVTAVSAPNIRASGPSPSGSCWTASRGCVFRYMTD